MCHEGGRCYRADSSLRVTGVGVTVTLTRLAVTQVQTPPCAGVTGGAVLQRRHTMITWHVTHLAGQFNYIHLAGEALVPGGKGL